MKKLAATTAVLLAAFVLTGCSAQLQDRENPDGTSAPDFIGDVSWVEVYRNADGFPNISFACVKQLGFATTSSSRGETGGAGPLIRMAELDEFCATKL